MSNNIVTDIHISRAEEETCFLEKSHSQNAQDADNQIVLGRAVRETVQGVIIEPKIESSKINEKK